MLYFNYILCDYNFFKLLLSNNKLEFILSLSQN